MMAATEREHVNRPPRWACGADITLVDHGGRELLARLGTISHKGFMAEAEEPRQPVAVAAFVVSAPSP